MYSVRAEISADINYLLDTTKYSWRFEKTDLALEKAIDCNAEQAALSSESQVASNLQPKYHRGQ